MRERRASGFQAVAGAALSVHLTTHTVSGLSQGAVGVAGFGGMAAGVFAALFAAMAGGFSLARRLWASRSGGRRGVVLARGRWRLGALREVEVRPLPRACTRQGAMTASQAMPAQS